MEAHGAADAVFGGISGNEAVAVIDDREGLQADNSRYALLNRSSRVAVLAVTATGDLDRDAFYVHQALAPGTGGGSLEVAGIAGDQLGGWPIERVSAYTAVLLLSTRGLDRRGRDLLASYAASGGGLLIAAGPDVDGDNRVGVLVCGLVGKWLFGYWQLRGDDERGGVGNGDLRRFPRKTTPSPFRRPAAARGR